MCTNLSRPSQSNVCVRSDMASKNAARFGLKCTKMLLIPLRTIPTVNATSIVCLTQQKIIKIVTMLLAQMGTDWERERDSFVCHIILQFYCENLHAKLTLSTHTAYLHKIHLKITVNRFTQLTTTSTKLCICSAHNLMVNFRFSASRLWVYSHCDFMSQLLTANTHILRLTGYVHYRYSFILRPIVIMVRMEFLPMRKTNTLSCVRFYFNIYF